MRQAEHLLPAARHALRQIPKSAQRVAPTARGQAQKPSARRCSACRGG